MSNACNNTIGERIGLTRSKANESQANLAAALGVKREMVTYWENGTRPIKAEMIVEIANRYGVSTDYLLGLAESPTREGDKQKAEEYAGLSADAVEYLRLMKEKAPDYSKSIDTLLSNPAFYNFVVSVLVERERIKIVDGIDFQFSLTRGDKEAIRALEKRSVVVLEPELAAGYYASLAGQNLTILLNNNSPFATVAEESGKNYIEYLKGKD